MSWLKLRRFLPARKAWKVFTTKLQSKLNNLSKSKAIKKPAHHINTSNNKAVFWPSTPRRSRLKRPRLTSQPPAHALLRYQGRYRLKKKTSKPVYIHELFVEPVSALKELTEVSKGTTEECSTSATQTELVNPPTEKNHSADELWESLALASPQMHGINERAEEFIARFRAEMQLQEMMSRHLNIRFDNLLLILLLLQLKVEASSYVKT